MEQKVRLGGVAVSLAALLSGCASKPYTQAQLGYTNTPHEKDLGGHVDLFCVRVRGGAKIGAKEASPEEIGERRDLIFRRIRRLTDSYFQQHQNDPRKADWNRVLGLEKAGEKVVLKQECDGNLYFGLDGIDQFLNPEPTANTINNVLDLSERIPNYTITIPGLLENQYYAFQELPEPLGAKEKCSRKEHTEEFRLGADVCYGALPNSTSQETYSVDVPVVGTQQTSVYEATKSRLVKISIPFLEYRYGTLEANIPGNVPEEIGIRSSEAKDVSLAMWVGAGYAIDFTVSETDYATVGGVLNDIPGVDVDGKFYGELNNEVTLFGKIPLGMSVRVDKDGKVMPLFMGGYKLQW